MSRQPVLRSSVKMRLYFVPESERSRENIRKGNKDRRLALKAVWRGSGKELRMPVPRDRMCLKNRGAALNVYQNHDGSCDSHRCCRMHHDAKRAMVAVRVHRMNVRHLHHSQQRQQKQAHDRHYRQSTWLCAAFPAQKCLEFCQHTRPLLKNTHLLDGLKPKMVTVEARNYRKETAQPSGLAPV